MTIYQPSLNPDKITFRRSVKKHWPVYLMLIPGILLIFIFHYIPMYGIVIAFKDYKAVHGVLGSPWADNGALEHFIKFFSSRNFPILLRNTFVMSVYAIIVGFPMPIIFALLLNEVRHMRYKKIVQTVSYMPNFISAVIICGIARTFLNSDGAILAVMRMLGSDRKLSLLAEPALFPTIVVLLEIWQVMGWNSIMYVAALSGIDSQLYEAARIDGCNRWGLTVHVTLPGILPTIVIMGIMALGGIMSVNDEYILLLYSPLTYETGDVFGTYLFRSGIQNGAYDSSAAVGLVLSVFGFGMVALFNWIGKKTTDISLW